MNSKNISMDYTFFDGHRDYSRLGCGVAERLDARCFPQQKCNRLLDCDQISLTAEYHSIDSKSGTGRMAASLWQVGLWQEGGQAAYSQGQFRSVFSVKLFVELSRPRPDFIDIQAPTGASSADVDWIKAWLSRGDRYPSSSKIANTSSRATLE
jgi:hypothetical protein